MSEVNLPEGWITTKLESLSTDISYGYTASSSSNEVGPKMLRITDIQDNSVIWSEVPYCEIEDNKLEKYQLRKNDLLFARTGATVGKSFLIRDEPPIAVYASYLIRVRTASDSVISLLSHFFNSQEYWKQITEFSSGIGQPNVNGTKLKGLMVPLPPLAEQKIITDKLDILLAQVESIKTRLGNIPDILKNFRQAVLAAAVSGKLTEEWRAGRQFNTSSEELGKLANFIDYRGRTPTKTDSGIPLITAKNIRQGFISREPREFIAHEDYDSWMTRGIPKFGDVLITTEAPMGYVANIDIEEKFALAQRAICLQFKEDINPYYASIYMQSYDFQKALDENATGSTVKGIKAASLKKIRITFPTKDEQTEIVHRIEEVFAFADLLEKKTNAALTRVNNLTQSILAKAFRGELTVDWRAANPELISGENSAEALLERIKAEREALKKQLKPTGNSIKKITGGLMSKQIIKVVDALKQTKEPLSGQQLLTAAGYPSDSSTEQLEKFFLDIRKALTEEKSIIKLERSDDGQDWFALAEIVEMNKA
ncbi:restriction endonuclease subunit S [Aeromonas enteropelogenes]|uniref:restriction endonuclease subunit S n=1 Tax=Aeromonas enteropelogenes TaxID=29489 RepID=UPI003B9FA9DB